MYTGMLIMYGFTPLALGSYWACIGIVFFIVIIVVRLFSEEKFLSENLDGYKEYLRKTKYRLVPWIW
jgi:protein-S-isoprenylcysteine O-methyltransferase Ste14